MKKVSAFGLALCMVFALCACGQQAENPVAAPVSAPAEANSEGTEKTTTFGLAPLDERTTLTIGFFAGSGHSVPWYVADKMGFFDELNIDAEYESFTGGPAMMEASASWDICDVGGPGVLNGMKNFDIQMIGECDNEGNTALFVRPDSEMAKDPKNPEVWKGKEVFLNQGTTLQYMFLNFLGEIGLTKDDVTITNMAVADAYNNFDNGNGDAMCVWNAFAYNADDAGYVRVTDAGQLGMNVSCGICATKDALETKPELIDLAWMVYYLTWDWCKQSDENLAKAVELYYESCEDEGVNTTESICERALNIFLCPAPADAVRVMIETEPDRDGSGTEVKKVVNDLYETLDFLISAGNYTNEDRADFLEKGLFNSSVAERCQPVFKELGYIE